MLTVAEALQLAAVHAGRQPTVRVPFWDAGGLTLAESVVSDVDSPPFSKSLMDGYAVRNADLASGLAELTVLGELPAGSIADKPVVAGTTWQIMTGAPLPDGGDAVVVVERSRRAAPDKVQLDDPNFRPDQNTMPMGREMRRGQTVLEPGALLGPPEIGLLAAVGCVEPLVFRRPTIGVLSTGDEIVAPHEIPGPGQIRNSNESTLVALAKRVGADVVSLGVARDDRGVIDKKVQEGMRCDVLLLSGGVSAGNRDFVPGVLADRGVRKVFQHVAFKPGKPVWFGEHDAGLVFGLPGNPVSVLVCFELFVRTALRARQGRSDVLPRELPARLAESFNFPINRLTYHPAAVSYETGEAVLRLVDWFGSPDLRALSAADALAILPVSSEPVAAGSSVRYLPLSRE